MTTHRQLKQTAQRDRPPFRRRQAVRMACPQADKSSERAVSLKGGPLGRGVGFLQGVTMDPFQKVTGRHDGLPSSWQGVITCCQLERRPVRTRCQLPSRRHDGPLSEGDGLS